MCWNKTVSIVSFLVGTSVTVWLYAAFTDISIQTVAVLWQFLLFMQVFEALSWWSQETQSVMLSQVASTGAFVFNMMQPIMVILLCLCVTRWAWARILLIVWLVCYVLALLPASTGLDLSPALYGHSDCHHLQYYWWASFPRYVFYLYLLIVVVGCLSLPNTTVGLIVLVYALLTLFLSSQFYECTYGSIWCWFAVGLPVLLLVYAKWKKMT